MHGHPKNTKPPPYCLWARRRPERKDSLHTALGYEGGGGFIVLGGGLAWVSILARSELAKYTPNEGIPFIIN